jgi:hypothetical protein
LLPDLSFNRKCGADNSGYKYVPDETSRECIKKPLQEIGASQSESFDSLDECCRDKFPNYITTCCDTAGSGGCEELGVEKWLPDWSNGHCYTKVSFQGRSE